MTERVDLAELTKLLAEATPGPWEVGKFSRDWHIQIEPDIASMWGTFGLGRFNADLIVAMHRDLPSLIAEIENLRRVIAAVRESLDRDVKLLERCERRREASRQQALSDAIAAFDDEYCKHDDPLMGVIRGRKAMGALLAALPASSATEGK